MLTSGLDYIKLIMHRILFMVLGVAALSLASCKRDEPTVYFPYQNGEIHTIPDGGTGIVSNVDLSGKGAQTNTATTTVVIDGTVTMDALTGNGTVRVPAGDTLIINDQFQMSGGSNLIVEGVVITKTFSQIGDVYMNNAQVYVSDQYQVSGGCTAYMRNSAVEASKLIIIGNVVGIEDTGYYAYNVLRSTGLKYLNRAGGSSVCGPVVLTNNNDQGASQMDLNDVSAEVKQKDAVLFEKYTALGDSLLYKYEDACAPVYEMPAY